MACARQFPAAALMGWLALALIGAVVAAALLAMRLPRPLWMLAGAALTLGAAGYAWQGSPGIAAAPARPDTATLDMAPDLVALRQAMFGAYDEGNAYFVLRDGMLRAGEPRLAARAMLGGVAKAPDSVAMWTGLGETLAIADGNQLSPPARFAFAQARRLGPAHPGPPFFEGVAKVRSGDFAGARVDWAQALRLVPAGASYRTGIATRLAMLDRVLGMQAGTDVRR